VLLVTTTMRMVDGVHSNTSDSGPGSSSLGLPSVVGVSSLADRLVGSATAGNQADHGSAGAGHGGAGAGGKSHTGLLAVVGVADDDGGAAGGAREGASVTGLGLAVRDDGTFGEGVHGQDIADREIGLSTSVDELASEKTLNSDEILSAVLVLVGVSEDNLGERSATAGVVHDFLDDSLDVAFTLGEVKSSELSRSNSL